MDETETNVSMEITVSWTTIEHIHYLTSYGAPIISVVGLLGNGVAIAALQSIPTTSWLLYVIALTVVQSIHLLVQLDTWVSEIGYGIYGMVGGWCQLVTFVSQASEFLALWYAVLLGLDRSAKMLVSKKYAHFLCRTTVARMTIISFSIIAIIVYVNISIVYGEVYLTANWPPRCDSLANFDNVVRRLKFADVFLNSVPALSLLTLAVVVMAMTNALNRQASTALSFDGGVIRRINSTELASLRIKMDGDQCALVILTVFLLFNIPVHVFRGYLAIVAFVSDSQMTLASYLTLQVLLTVKHLNEASNFPLLMASSRLFRKSLKSFCRKPIRARKVVRNDGQDKDVAAA